MIVIGEVNAAAQPLCAGFARLALYWLTTCCFTCASHWSGVIDVGRRRGELRELQRVGVGRQRLEELDATREVVDRETGVGVEQDALRQVDAEEHAERAELARARAGS